MENLEGSESIIRWRVDPEVSARFGESFLERQCDAVFLARERYRHAPRTEQPLPARVAAFVEEAREYELQDEARSLGCLRVMPPLSNRDLHMLALLASARLCLLCHMCWMT